MKLFKLTRINIIVLLMISITVLLIGVFTTIYSTSYSAVYNSCQEMLEKYCKSFSDGGNKGEGGFKPDERISQPDDLPPNDNSSDDEGPPEMNRIFAVSSFCSVYFNEDGSVNNIDNIDNVYSDDELISYSRKILEKNSDQGKTDSFIYRVERSSKHTMVAFVDTTIFENNTSVLMRYTLIFGFAALIIIFIISLLVSTRIVRPLEEYDRKQRQFITDAGHELKTPVAVINTNAEMLKRDMGSSKWLDNIVYENNKMGTLISKLMELSRSENSKEQLTDVDFSRIVKGEALALESIAYEKEIAINYYEVDDNIMVKGAEGKLTELVTILIDNAICYGNNERAICISLKRNTSKAVLSISNGINEMSENDFKHLFDRFYRSDKARSDDGHYGLGLSIAKAIVQNHKGNITADYKDGYITFTVQIPVK